MQRRVIEFKGEFTNRNEHKQSQSIDAAALQADMARRFKLPGSSMVAMNKPPQRRRTSNTTQTTKSSSSTMIHQQQHKQTAPRVYCCSCCGEPNDATCSICGSCGYFLRSADHQTTTTLSELRGLVKAAPKIDVLEQSQWDTIEDKLEGRKDAYCPICMEAFNQGREVLLSCSHMFHQACLSAFEKFMKSEGNAAVVTCGICLNSSGSNSTPRSSPLPLPPPPVCVSLSSYFPSSAVRLHVFLDPPLICLVCPAHSSLPHF